MKGFRRWLGFLLVLLVCLTACGSTGKKSTETPAETEKETERVSAGPEGTDDSVAVNPKGTLTIGFVMIGSESDWRIACNRSVEEAFSRENGYYLVVRDGQQKQENQMKAMREFIDMDVDYILLNPIAENGWDAVLQEAREAGIPVVVFDRKVRAADPDAYTTWIGSDFLLEGRRACAWLEEFLKSRQYDDRLNIVHLQGTMESSAQIGRTRALDEALRRNRKWNLLERKPAEFTTAKAKEVMTDMLKLYGDRIQVVYCENDNMAYGAIESIERSGRNVGANLERGDVLVISFDAVHRAMELALKDDIAVVTECDPLYGPRLTQIIQQLKRGETPEHEIYVKEAQFSAIWEPSRVVVNGTTHKVTRLTEEIVENREY